MTEAADEFIFSNPDIAIKYRDYITSILPKQNSRILDVSESNDLCTIKLLTNCNTSEEITSWVKELEEKTFSRYSIRCSKRCTGRYLDVKKYLQCHHNTKSNKLCDISDPKNRSRNTNCPSTIRITMYADKAHRRQDKEFSIFLKEMRCEIEFIATHNHTTNSSDFLRFRKVCSDVVSKLLQLYKNGHSPASALETIKIDIQLNNDNYEAILTDRKYCPDYMFCYHLYIKELKTKHFDFNLSAQPFLKDKITEYNNKTKETCAQVVFYGADYVICICPPLFKRVHQNVTSASQIVFMDSTGSTDQKGSRVSVLLTHGDCGGLPLGVLITSSESADIIQKGFELLKEVVGTSIFGGHIEGPAVFLTEDSNSERAAIKAAWPKSKSLLCMFHVLQAIWRWLLKAKNSIPEEKQITYFQNFCEIMYSKTENECCLNYGVAKNNITNENYRKYLEMYWERRHLWALAYRNSLLIKDKTANNYSEAVMKIIKDQIFNRVKAFNVVQLVDFFFDIFVSYYEIRLLDAANDRLRKNIFGRTIRLPPDHVASRLQTVDSNTVLIPSENEENLFYIVNTNALLCSCFEGNTVKICKHVDWACMFVHSYNFIKLLDNVNLRKQLYFIAKGYYPDREWLSTLYLNTNNAKNHRKSNEDLETSNEPMKKCLKLLSQLNAIIINHGEKAPAEIITGLTKAVENISKVRTHAGVASALSNFAVDYESIEVQPTALS